MATKRKSKNSDAAALAIFARVAPIKRTAEQQRAAEDEDREARRRGRYYRGVARRIRHGMLSQDEQQLLRDDKRRVAAIRESVGG